jgi:putative oxidoreductase
MKYLPIICRIALGLVFLVFGLNGFFSFIPLPAFEGAAIDFMGGLGASGYFFPFLKMTEILCGIALITGFFVPLALAVLFPITINIFLFHIFLAEAGLIPSFVFLCMNVFLANTYRNSYEGLWAMKTSLDS